MFIKIKIRKTIGNLAILQIDMNYISETQRVGERPWVNYSANPSVDINQY